jgi:hypothetical protein
MLSQSAADPKPKPKPDTDADPSEPVLKLGALHTNIRGVDDPRSPQLDRMWQIQVAFACDHRSRTDRKRVPSER